MLKAVPVLILTAVLGVTSGSGCGVKQFNDGKSAKIVPSGRLVAGYGPFYSSGQGTGEMTTGACNSATGRPCAKARVSVGMPYQFDINSNNTQAIVAGTGFPNPAVPYTTSAGAGRTQVSSGPRAPAHPRIENRDLHIMKRQAGSGEHTF